jgi:putative SOS response-associated peptidase YedK
MPIIPDNPAADDWMNPTEADPLSLKLLLIPAPHDVLLAQPAALLANSVNNDSPGLPVAT